MSELPALNWKKELRKLSKERLVDFIGMMTDNFWTMQNNWIINVEKDYGHDVTMKFDGLVWGRLMEVTVWRMKRFFNLGDDIQALHKVFKFAVFQNYADMVFPVITEKKLIRRVTRCPMQISRLERGESEIPCKFALLKSYPRLVKAVNPKMDVIRIMAPPDPHPEGIWCEVDIELKN